MIYMGIDPGFKGGIAVIKGNQKLLSTIPMPLAIKRGKDKKNRVSESSIKSIILKIKPDYIIIEKQHLTAGDGKISNTSIVGGYNLLKGMAYMYLDNPNNLIDVHPMTWHKLILGKARMKRDESKQLAEKKTLELFPHHNFKATPRCRNNHDGMIDAALLAYYGYMMKRDS